MQFYRVRETKSKKLEIIDVDGSYTHRKYQQMVASGISVANPGPPAKPLTGWEQVQESNYNEMAKKIPQVTHGEFFSNL